MGWRQASGVSLKAFLGSFPGAHKYTGIDVSHFAIPSPGTTGQRGAPALDGFRIVQLKNENSDSPRDLGQMTSDFERSWGRAHAPEYWLVDLNPYQL